MPQNIDDSYYRSLTKNNILNSSKVMMNDLKEISKKTEDFVQNITLEEKSDVYSIN